MKIKPTWTDLGILVCYLSAAIFLLGRLLRHGSHAQLAFSGLDQTQEEWFLAHAAHAMANLNNPLFATVGNSPLGINLMANASVLGLAIPLVPITLLFGPQISFLVAMTAGLFGTATAWYWLFSRHLVDSRPAAAVAGAFCGFAPAVVSHANGGHLNFVSSFLVPVIVWRVVKLREAGRSIHNGVILGLLITWQCFIAEEPLLIAALGLVVFLGAYTVIRRPALRAFLLGSGIAAGVSGLLLAYPLWFQFFGPQSYNGVFGVSTAGNNLASITAFSGQSLGGTRPLPPWMALNVSEENAFFGWTLLIGAVLLTVWLWRESVVACAAAITTGAALVASLGVQLKVASIDTGIPGPWSVFARLPILESLLPTRLAMIAIPGIAVLLALGMAKALRTPSARLWCVGLCVAALVPLMPTPLPVTNRPAVPAFFTEGIWRQYVGPGRAIVSAVPHNNGYGEPMRWQIAADMGFANVAGYFLGPVGKGGVGTYTPEERLTTRLFKASYEKRMVVKMPEATPRIVEDLRLWRADAIVLATDHEPLRRTVESIFGPGETVGGIHVWDVRQISATIRDHSATVR